jgi:NitT/TauT family transport system permease protein
LVVWQVAAEIVDQPLYLPSVAETFKHIWGVVQGEAFWRNVVVTFYRVVAGLFISSSLGVVLAILSSLAPWVEAFFAPFLTTVKSIPTMSIIILALVWFKSGNVPIFVSFLICFPMLYSNTLTGIKEINPMLLEFCRVHHIPFKRTLSDVMIPSVWPYVRAAFFVAIGFCWKATIAAEVLSAPKASMGYELYLTKLYLDIPELFAWTVIIVSITMVIEKLLKHVVTKQHLVAKQGQPSHDH